MREGTAAIAALRARFAYVSLRLFALIALASVAAAAMPPRGWRDAERLVVLCSVDAGNELGHAEIARGLCDRIVRIAGPDAPVPIEIAEFGGKSLIAPGSVALLVHASVSPAADAVPGARGRLLSWTMRTRGSDQGAPTWFGAAPRVASFGDDLDTSAIDAGLRASLGDVLPWLHTAEADLLSNETNLSNRGYRE